VNPALGSIPATTLEVRIERGFVLPGRAWCAEAPRALIAVVHGLGEHSGRYAALASDLVHAGYTVAALDLPGHGESEGPRGDIPSWQRLRDQIVPALFTATRGLPGQPLELPVFLFGHSMGGVIALDHALARPRGLAGVAVTGPALRTTLPPWWKLALANIARVTTPSAGFPNGLDRTGLSRDPEVVRLYLEDPLVHDKISPRLYFAFNEACQRALRDARRLHLPAMIMQGEADRVVKPEGAAEFARAATDEFARLVTYPDAYHELFNDTDRARVIDDFVAWLVEVAG
jgi:alpha-beta hydrolase superfamily lysophospholipase